MATPTYTNPKLSLTQPTPGVSVLYTGDFNTTPDRHLGPAHLPPALRPDLLITESTYANTVRESKRSREREFLMQVHATTTAIYKPILAPNLTLTLTLALTLTLTLTTDPNPDPHPNLHPTGARDGHRRRQGPHPRLRPRPRAGATHTPYSLLPLPLLLTYYLLLLLTSRREAEAVGDAGAHHAHLVRG